ncbi:SDR family oxidoreductase [Leptospira sp. 96542]|nr:SDR family oxidoreductase [Leptospira sp. 96542]
MEAIRNQVIAITGASSGIGMATAEVLAGMGARLVIGARRTDRLEELAGKLRQQGAQVLTVALDVRQRASVQNFVDLAVQTYGRIDVLVNNAGVMPLSKLSVGKVDEWEDTIDINVKGVLYGIAAALPRMKAQGAGHLVSVASVGAHHAFPGAAVYCGSKFAVWAICEALRQEEIEGDIRVTTISPGTIRSELADSITDPDAAAAMRDFRAVTIEPEAIAQAIAYAIAQPREVSVSEVVVRPTRSPA